MTALREKPRTEGGGEEKRSDTINYGVPALAKGARVQRTASYLRRIHQTEPVTRIKLPPIAEKSSMPCFP